MEKKQQLNFFSITIITISLIVGMGIFKMPATIAAKSVTQSVFFSAWILCGIVTLMGAVIFSELGFLITEMGAYYKIFSVSYHPSIAFTINILILISNASTLGIITLIGADYLSDFLFHHPASHQFNALIAILFIGVFYIVNLLGLQSSSKTQNILMVIKITAILLLSASLFTNVIVEPHGYDANPSIYSLNTYHPLTLLVFALVSTSFICGGYQQAINFGGEVKNKHLLYKGIIAGTLISITLYILLNIAYIHVIGFDKMKNATAIGALLCEALFSTQGAMAFDAFMLLSVLAYVNVLLLSNPRVMYAMSIDKTLPSLFAYKHPKTQVLVPSLTIFACLAIVVVFLGKGVDNILSFTMVLDSAGMSFSAFALLVLIKRKTNKIPVKYIIICSIFIIFYLLVTSAVIIDKPLSALTAFSLMAFFIIIFFISRHFNKR